MKKAILVAVEDHTVACDMITWVLASGDGWSDILDRVEEVIRQIEVEDKPAVRTRTDADITKFIATLRKNKPIGLRGAMSRLDKLSAYVCDNYDDVYIHLSMVEVLG